MKAAKIMGHHFERGARIPAETGSRFMSGRIVANDSMPIKNHHRVNNLAFRGHPLRRNS
jgi:hypothetical protein